MTLAQTADEAFDLYETAFTANALTQGSWHKRNGKDLACALGVLGDEINNVRDCPASVMPRWLAQHVVWFFDGQSFDDAKAWGLAFYAELKRLKGVVPFSVVHDWQATVVGPFAIETAALRKLDQALPEALRALHERAMKGEKISRDEWYAGLQPAFRQLYPANAYAYADADAYADANADAYANAYANANAYAYADANANAYADANANANANADANANAYANATAYAYAKRQENIKRLADGMVECMRRVPSPI